jgi:hypothetical protein
MSKCANISPYVRRPLVIYDFATAPLCMRKIWFSFLSVYCMYSVRISSVNSVKKRLLTIMTCFSTYVKISNVLKNCLGRTSQAIFVYPLIKNLLLKVPSILFYSILFNIKIGKNLPEISIGFSLHNACCKLVGWTAGQIADFPGLPGFTLTSDHWPPTNDFSVSRF